LSLSGRSVFRFQSVKSEFFSSRLLKLKFNFNSLTIVLSVRRNLGLIRNQTVNLTNLPIGENAKITAVRGDNQITRRLMEMGVVPGASVRMIKSAPFGDPLEVRVRGYHLAMRKSEADRITVQSSELKIQS